MYFSNIGPQWYFLNNAPAVTQSGSASANCVALPVYASDPKWVTLYMSNTGATCTNDISYVDPYGNTVSFTQVSTNLTVNSFTVSFTPVPAPTLSGLSVASGTTLGGTSLTISGNYLLFSTVTIGGANAPVTASTATSLTVTTPAHVAGAVDVVVTAPSGSATLAGAFTYMPAPQATLTASAAPSTLTFGVGTSALSTTGGSGTGAVSYNVVSGPCSIAGSTLSATGAGTCSITATKAANTTYAAATSAPISVTVNPGTQAALAASASPAAISFNGTSTLSTTGGSGTGAVTFAVTAGGSFCSVSGATLTGTGVGSCTVTATKAADTNYNAATATVNVTVNQAAQSALTAAASPASIVYGATSALSTTGGSGTGAVTYAVTAGASFCSMSGSTLTGTGVGSCTVTATKAADTNYTATTATANVSVGQATQTTPLGFTMSPSAITVGSSATLSGTGGNGTGAYGYAVVLGGSFCSISGNVITGTAAGVCMIQVTKAGDTNYQSAAINSNVSVGLGTQAALTVTAAPTNIAFGSTTSLSSSGGSGTGAVTYAVTAGASFCSLSGGTLTGTGVGTCTVTATKAADANYSAATATVDVGVGKAAQAALGGTVSPSPVVFGTTSTLVTSGGSGTGAVTSTVVLGPSFCSISGNQLTGTGVGVCQVQMTKAADANYNAASILFNVSVTQAAQSTLTATASPAAISFGGTSALSATGGSGTGAVTYAVTGGGAFCSVSGATVTGIGVGTCTVTATKAADANYSVATSTVDVTVGKAAQAALTVDAAPTSISFGGASTLSASGGSGSGAVSYAVTAGGANCSISGTTLTGIGVGACTVTATKAADANYNVATATVGVTVGKAAQTALSSTASPSSIAVNGTSKLSTAGGSGTGSVTYAVSAGSSSCSVAGNTLTGLAVGNCTVTATKAADASYNAATATTSVTVSQATATVALSGPSGSMQIGQTAKFTAIVTPSTATGTMSFMLNGAPVCSNVAIVGGSATCDITFSQAGTQSIAANYNGNGAFASATSAATTVATNDSVKKTVQVASTFMNQRANMVAGGGPDGGRQVSRLLEADGSSGSGVEGPAGAGFASTTSSSRLGAGPDAGEMSRMRLGLRGSTSRDVLPNENSVEVPSGSGLLAALRPNANTEGPATFSFSTSLSALRQASLAAEEQRARAAGSEGYAFGPGRTSSGRSAFSPLDIWVEGRYGSFRDTRVLGGADGHYGLISGGIDYVLNPAFLVGAYIQVDDMRQRAAGAASEVSGRGWMAGPYATLRLSPNLFWQSRAAWGRSSNDMNPYGTYTDSFDTKRWLAATALTGRYVRGSWTIVPSASITYFEDVSDAYFDTYGAAIPSMKVSLGQAKVGPVVSYRHQMVDGLILEPRVGAELIWNFDTSTRVDGVTDLGEVAGPDGVRGRVELGLRASRDVGPSLDVSGSYDGIGANGFHAVSGRATVRVPLN